MLNYNTWGYAIHKNGANRLCSNLNQHTMPYSAKPTAFDTHKCISFLFRLVVIYGIMKTWQRSDSYLIIIITMSNWVMWMMKVQQNKHSWFAFKYAGVTMLFLYDKLDWLNPKMNISIVSSMLTSIESTTFLYNIFSYALLHCTLVSHWCSHLNSARDCSVWIKHTLK